MTKTNQATLKRLLHSLYNQASAMNEYHKDIAEFKVNKTMGLVVKLFEGG